jgi:hypothetical protein
VRRHRRLRSWRRRKAEALFDVIQPPRLLAQHLVHLIDAFDELSDAVLSGVFVGHSLRHLCVS